MRAFPHMKKLFWNSRLLDSVGLLPEDLVAIDIPGHANDEIMTDQTFFVKLKNNKNV